MSFIIFIAPSKTFNQKATLGTSPLIFKDEVSYLLSHLKQMSIDDIGQKMKVSEKIAKEVYAYYHNPSGGRAFSLYSGVSYKAMNAENLELNHQKLYIIDALYGLIRPEDHLDRYRLDFTMNCLGNLYHYWQDKIKKYLDDMHPHDIFIDLASHEFSSLLPKDRLVIRIDFKLLDRSISNVLLKQMRGKMTRYLLENPLKQLSDLQEIKIEGFTYNPQLSNSNTYLFTR